MKRDWILVATFLLRQWWGRISPPSSSDTLLIIFSKDRAMQLDALLRSIKLHTTGRPRVVLLWRASDEQHRAAYLEVMARSRDVLSSDQEETRFRDDLLQIMSEAKESRVMFLVDDIVFINPFDFARTTAINPFSSIVSIRMWPGITYCQTENLQTPPPPLRPYPQGNFLEFSWTTGKGDWAMPLSVDGNIFNLREMLSLFRTISFKAPNSLEGAIGVYRFLFKYRRGLCPSKPAFINLAINGVQSEGFKFPHGDISAGQLLELWNSGFEMDLEALKNMEAASCHITTGPSFRRRS